MKTFAIFLALSTILFANTTFAGQAKRAWDGEQAARQGAQTARSGAESLAKSAINEALGKVGGVVGTIDATTIDPVITYFTTGGNENQLEAAFGKFLEGVVGLRFSTLGIAINAGRVIIGGSQYYVARIINESEKRRTEDILVGYQRAIPDQILKVKTLGGKTEPFFDWVKRKRRICGVNFGYSTTEGYTRLIGKKVTSESTLMCIWNGYMSQFRGMGAVFDEVDQGYIPLRKLWQLRRKEAVAEQKLVAYHKLQDFKKEFIKSIREAKRNQDVGSKGRFYGNRGKEVVVWIARKGRGSVRELFIGSRDGYNSLSNKWIDKKILRSRLKNQQSATNWICSQLSHFRSAKFVGSVADYRGEMVYEGRIGCRKGQR